MNYSRLVYRSRFQNVEENIVNIDIWDMAASFGDNPYNINVNVVDNGDSTQTVTFTFDEIPGVITSISIDYSSDNGVNWTTQAGAITSPRSITIPTGDYIYRFVVTRPTLTQTVSFNATNNLIFGPSTDFFYAGQRIRIEGSASNDGEYDVVDTILFLIQITLLTQALTDEEDIEVTFTDITHSESFIVGQTVEEVDLIPGGDPLHIQTTDNDEDKFTPVLGKTAVIQFLSESGIGFNTFAEGEDDRFFVHIYVGDDDTLTVFKGYLVLEDNSELFMPESNEVILTATDNLGLLADVPLLDFDGEVPQNENQIMDYIAWALAGTGLQLPIFVAMNIREAEAPALLDDESGEGHFYKWIFLDARTFEDEIGTCHNRLEVLEKILGYEVKLIQRSGGWWLYRVDEFEARDGLYVYEFDYQGNFVANHGLVDLRKEIFKGEDDGSGEGDIFFSEEQTNVQAEQARREVKLTYRLDYPKEIICNIDYDRGEVNTDPDVQLTDYTAYHLECWDVRKLWGDDLVAGDFKASIQRKFNELDDEDERFIMLTYPASAAPNNYIRSQAIPINEDDKFRFNFDVAAVDDVAGDGTITVCMIILYGVDGNVYILREADTSVGWDNTLGEIDTSWKLTDAEISLFRSGLNWAIFDDADHPNKTEWTPCVIVGAPVPVAGNMYIHLFAANQFVDGYDTFRIKYQDLAFEYRPYIGGSYSRYNARYSKVSQTLKYRQVIDEDVFISDSPKNIFKGALLKEGASGEEFPHSLANQFYNAAVFPDAVPDAEFIHPYYHIQNFDVWNQYNRSFRIFQAQSQGLMTDDVDDLGLNDAADSVHKWTLADPNESTNNRYFLLLTFDQDWYLCEWTGTLKEVFKTDVDKDYASAHEIKYITE